MALKLIKRGEVYYLRGTVAGQPVYETTGTRDKALAEAIRIKKESRLANEAVHGRKHTATFLDAALSYSQAGAPTRFIMDTRKSDGVDSGLAVYFGERRLKDISQADLDKAASVLYPKAKRETLIRQVYTPFTAVWNHAVRMEMADVRKWARPRAPRGTNVMSLPQKTRAGSSPTSYEDAGRFVASMSPDPGMLVAFLFFTGLRPIEAFALRGEDVDVAKRWIVVRSSKTGQPRGVPMHRWLATWIGALVDRSNLDGERLFRTPRGRPYSPVKEGGGGLKTAILGARRRSGLSLSPYTARHTVSTQLVVAGVHPHIKDQILGHAVDDMSRHYTSVPQAALIEAIDKLPVTSEFASLPWLNTPSAWWGKLAEGTGRRNDLKSRVA